ncbi:MAG: DUF4954 family protein, partial [Mariniphaga sp.]|nr:DUF4954 family protein [Mariniphaga sp.]
MHRNLSDTEINTLKKQGCSSSEWAKIFIKDGASLKFFVNTRFTGSCKLGIFDKEIQVEQGIFKESGIYNSHLSDCTVGDNVFISNASAVSIYDIG